MVKGGNSSKNEADPELEVIRQRRMQELMAQCGKSAKL